ncbi:hypothetical protein SUGI_0441020 [Cryptomeria japonica]|uniref:uncharacterized protein LOC131032089 n=1 Tax=Cryptomeria japonica TaxID=3369 RepID=UPI002408A8DC|nr:uncharacterized protein LOC131032089 [Cryptomeria japonica]GLJ23312.1 hypothetical protein SUGI_0441020 [Cryptomeria japonica]
MVRQVVQVDHESQRFVEAAHRGDVMVVADCLANPLVDVNYRGTVSFRVKSTDIIHHEEAPDEVKFGYEEFKTDVTALFVAAHAGRVDLIRRLLSAGADVNQKLFRGYATTAAAREGHHQVLGMLLKAGASQPACEDALLEACRYGQTKSAELLISSEMIRPAVSVHALVYACCRGFVDIVATLTKSGVDANSWDRTLLRSAKPALYVNVNCTPLFAAIVSRQASVVRHLLEVGVKTDCNVSLGAWSWDTNSGEELRVGAGLAEPYNEAWCAVEYYEASGTIIRLLLQRLSPDSEHRGRTLICHAILFRNARAVQVLLDAGANADFCVRLTNGHEFRPLHMASRMGYLVILKQLIEHGCDLNARTESGETALMLSIKSNHLECFRELLFSGADLAIVNLAGQNAVNMAETNNCILSIYQIVSEAIRAGKKLYSSNFQLFSPLHFVAGFGDGMVVQKLIKQPGLSLNEQDKNGFSAAMIAVKEGHIEVFKVLVFAGADLGLKNKKGETAISLYLTHGKRDHFEKVMLDATLANCLKGEGFKALHYAARRGNLEAIGQLLKRGYSVNNFDEAGYTPLMLAAREGHADACKILVLGGADCSIVNHKGETALLLARRNGLSKIAEGVILDHLARKFVLAGDQLNKHTRQGKGSPHMKMVRMLKSGMFSWGKSRRRNVIIREAILGPSPTFRKNRRKDDVNKGGIFRIVTVKKKEFHFVARNDANAELWVRGINLITKEVFASNGPGAGK